MEGEICQFDKYGYCRYKSDCKRKHFDVVCEDAEHCRSIKSCLKRHPKCCKRYASGSCRFAEGCAYAHKKPAINEDHAHLNEKLQQLEKVVDTLTQKVLSLETEKLEVKNKRATSETLEKVVHALTRKVWSLETEMLEVKNKRNTSETLEEPRESNVLNVEVIESGIDVKKEKPNINLLENKNYLLHKDTISKTKKKKELVENDVEEEFLKCKTCDYKTKKESTLKKHMIAKHEDHECNECKERFQNFMELMKHEAKLHIKELDNTDQGEIGAKEIPKEDKEDVKKKKVSDFRIE